MSLIIEKLFQHTESFSLGPLKSQFEIANTSSNSTHIVKATKNSITPAEYDLSLRFAI